MRRRGGVGERSRLEEATCLVLTDADDIELETTLQELALDLRGDTVETDMALGVNAVGRNSRHSNGVVGTLGRLRKCKR